MPAPGWNTTYDGDSDLSHVDFANMFVDAVNERWWTPGGLATGRRLSARMPYKSVGDDVQDLAFVTFLQDICERGCPDFLNPHVAYDGSTYTLDGDFQLFLDTWQSWTNYCAIRKSGNSWTRKYPREFATLASTQYTDTDAFANGDYARNLADSLVYRRVAGAWVVQTAAATLPDVVTKYGRVAADDFVGPWLFNEIRDVMNDCVWLTESVGVGTNAAAASTLRQNSLGNWPSSLSMADAYTLALAHFPDPGGPYASDVGINVPTCQVQGSYNAGLAQWTCGPTTEQSKYAIAVSGLAINPPGTCDIDVLICSNPPGTTGITRTYECPFGYPLRTRTRVETVARGGAATTVYTATAYGDVTRTVTNPPPDIAPATTDCSNGWVGRAVAIIRCDVTGGYQYHA